MAGRVAAASRCIMQLRTGQSIEMQAAFSCIHGPGGEFPGGNGRRQGLDTPAQRA